MKTNMSGLSGRLASLASLLTGKPHQLAACSLLRLKLREGTSGVGRNTPAASFERLAQTMKTRLKSKT